MAYGSSQPVASDSLATSQPLIRANFSYLETMLNPTTCAEEHIISGVGEIRMFGGAAAAVWKGWLICDGSAYSRTNASYAGLYSVIGTAYGTGDGSTTFNVPSFCNVFVRGVAASPGSTGGNDSHTNTAGTYTVNTYHRHTAGAAGTINTDLALDNNPYTAPRYTDYQGGASTAVSGSSGAGDNIPKYGTAIYIIKR